MNSGSSAVLLDKKHHFYKTCWPYLGARILLQLDWIVEKMHCVLPRYNQTCLCRFMDKIQEQIDGIEEDAETVKDLYSLVEQYQVPVNPEDLAVYQVII